MKLSERKILVFMVLSVSVAISVLFGFGQNEALRAQRNTWSVSFSDLTEANVDFLINNQSDTRTFHWSIFKDKRELGSGSVTVATRGTERIAPSISEDGKRASGKVLIRVTGEDGLTREIYKVLSK